MSSREEVHVYPRCAECGYVAADPGTRVVEGKTFCGSCADRLHPLPAHASGCGCAVCETRAHGEKHETRVAAFVKTRPMQKWPGKRGRGWSST